MINPGLWERCIPVLIIHYPVVWKILIFGPVDGTWTLSVVNNSPVNTAEILNFSVIFCDDEGLDCFECEAYAGGFEDSTAIVACLGDTSLFLDLEPDFGNNDFDSLIYGYTYIISEQDTILAYDTIPDLTGYGAGEYKINGFAYRWADSLDIPPANGNTTITSLNQDLITNSSFFCGDVTDFCLLVSIIEIDTTFLTDTLCFGETLIFGLDSIFIPPDTIINNGDTTFIPPDTLITAIDTLTSSGVYAFDFQSVDGCDSTVVFDLAIRR